MEIVSNAYIAAIPVLIFVVFLILAKKDKKEDALLKKRITDSISARSMPSPSSNDTEKEIVSNLDM